MSVNTDIEALDFIIKFTRDPKIKSDFIAAKEMMEFAAYFIAASHDIVASHNKEMAAVIRMAHRATSIEKDIKGDPNDRFNENVRTYFGDDSSH